MENLESLKDIWKNQEESKIRFTRQDIHKMVQQKSSSIVKWILIISLLEFILPNLVFLFTDFEATKKFYAQYGLTNTMMFYTCLHVLIIIAFIYVFYRNYRNISAESTVKVLLSNILKTRSTVKYYIYYNLTIMGIIGLNMFYAVYHSEEFLNKLDNGASMLMIWTISIVLLGLALLIFWLFYRLLYGLLLKKLTRNYAELSNQNDL
jgi:nitrate/nitrite transporter NarK